MTLQTPYAIRFGASLVICVCRTECLQPHWRLAFDAKQVWGVYSAITIAETGEDQLGFLRSWAEGALHPVDVISQWWT